MRAFARDLICGGHYGQRPVCRANRPNTWLHRPACKREENPCQLGAVHTWHNPGPLAPIRQATESSRAPVVRRLDELSALERFTDSSRTSPGRVLSQSTTLARPFAVV